MEKLPDTEDLPPIRVQLRCPNCGTDFPVDPPIDRQKTYDCPKCTYEFNLVGRDRFVQ